MIPGRAYCISPTRKCPLSFVGMTLEQWNTRAASLDDVRAKYNELLYAVAKKYPGQTRHETALMYITRAEETTGDAQAAAEPRAPQPRKADDHAQT